MSVEQLEKEFLNPSAKFRAKPFWAWNDELEGGELRRQIRIFREMGLGGFFMHSRVGLKTPYLSEEWFDLVKACIDEARRTDTEAWLYDEDRWPSGAAGGLVTKDPRYQIRYLELSRHDHPETFDWPEPDETAYIFGATFKEDKIAWYKKLDRQEAIQILPQGAEILKFAVRTAEPDSWYNGYTYLDTLNPEAVGKFIEVTHEAYRREVGEHFGSIVPGIFTDEPNHGGTFDGPPLLPIGMPWTDLLPQRFQEMFDYDVILHLPEIAFDLVDKPFSQVRYHYHRCRARMFVESFSKQIGEWCRRNNLLHTGHVLYEEPISGQVATVSAAMQFYPYMQAPGIDILSQYRREYITAKQCSSVAHQTGRKWVLSELYGCTGWETTFETYKHIGDWQAALGITLRCPHLSWYSMAGEAKRDYPASIHFHSPWWRQFKYLEDYFSRLNVVLTEGEPICDLAVIHPAESYYLMFASNWRENGQIKRMDRDYYQMVCWLLGGHLDFDFADEHLLVELAAQIGNDEDGPYLQIGKMKYRAVLVPPVLTVRKTTLELLGQFAQVGGKVVFVDSTPQLVETEPSEDIKEFAQGRTVPFSFDAITNALQDQVRRVSIRDQQNHEATDVFHQFRRIGDDWVIFMVNTNRERSCDNLNVRLKVELPRGGQIQLWDPATADKDKLAGELTYRTVSFTIDIPPSGSRLVVISSKPEELPAHSKPSGSGNELKLEPAGWNFLLDDHNVLVLDRADCKAEIDGKGTFSRSQVEILHLDRELRDHLGIERRGGTMTQPWAVQDQPIGPTARTKLTYKFNVKSLPTSPLLLAVEQPERWEIKLNDQVIPSSMATGWWVDPALKTLPVDPAILKRGRNTITLEGQFDRQTDLEIMYLLGQFGVDVSGKNASISKMPTKLTLGSWLSRGLPFYSGNVVYRTNFELQINPGRRYLLKFSRFSATAIEVSLNGAASQIIAWPEYQVDITPQLKNGKNTIDIKLLGSRRNAFGPLHLADDKPEWIGPGSFAHDPDKWQDQYRLTDYGLYEPPVIAEYSAG